MTNTTAAKALPETLEAAPEVKETGAADWVEDEPETLVDIEPDNGL